MKRFSFNRLWLMLRWLVSVNRVWLLGMTVGFAFAVFMIQLLIFVLSPSEDVISYLFNCAGFGDFMIPILMAVLVCSLFSNYTSIGSKQQRGTFLMIPATNLEKFLAVVIYVTVVCGLCAIVGYVLGDCLRMACLWMWGQVSADPELSAGMVYNYNGADRTYCLWSSTVPWVFGRLTPYLITVWSSGIYWDWLMWARFIHDMLLAIWIHSFFTLGGTLLRKYSFVITGVVWLAIVLLFLGFLQHFNLSVFIKEWFVDHYEYTTVGSMAYVLMVVLPLFSCFNYWASFRIFKGFQLITNKWTNYDLFKR